MSQLTPGSRTSALRGDRRDKQYRVESSLPVYNIKKTLTAPAFKALTAPAGRQKDAPALQRRKRRSLANARLKVTRL